MREFTFIRLLNARLNSYENSNLEEDDFIYSNETFFET